MWGLRGVRVREAGEGARAREAGVSTMLNISTRASLRSHGRAPRRTRLAAALTLAAVAWWFVPSRAAATQHYATAATRQQQVALVDGSVVNLNVGTDVQVALTPSARRVTLTAGEAHFAVAHDTARPFIVTAGGVVVTSVGIGWRWYATRRAAELADALDRFLLYYAQRRKEVMPKLLGKEAA